MEKSLKRVLLFATLMCIPLLASAHERHVIRIGDKTYALVVGLANEPVFVDDKSGFDLRLRLADPADPLNFSSPRLKPVENVETSLQVEISAGGKKKVFELEPAFRDAGLYHATFIPTAATTYGFRLFGRLNATPVDLTFTCIAGEHPRPAENRSEVKLSPGVTRLFKSGAFECPAARSTVAFP